MMTDPRPSPRVLLTRALMLPAALVRFGAFFLWQLVKANVRVAREVLTPGLRMDPAIIAVPTRAHGTLETVLLGNAISLTPGTLTLEVDEEHRVLYVHTLYLGTREAFLRQVANLEDELLRVSRHFSMERPR
jgi:multicomponent Na+:H+ antiporter subunit E